MEAINAYRPDPAALKSLWQTVFGDGPEIIDLWFDTFYRPELTAAIMAEEGPAAMAYVLPAGSLGGLPCAHIYAVGVDPALRGRGLGIEVTRLAVEKALTAGYPAVILHPADAGLFDFYRRHCGFETLCSVTEQTVTLPASGNSAAAAPQRVSPAQYRLLRRRFLSSGPSVDQSEAVLSFFEACGGRLYAGENFCAAAEVWEGRACFRELLFTGPLPGRELLSAMAPGAQKADLRCPALPVGQQLPFAMIYVHDGLPDGFLTQQTACWPGLALE